MHVAYGLKVYAERLDDEKVELPEVRPHKDDLRQG